MIHRPPDARPGGQPHVRKTFPFRSLPEGPLTATSGSSWIRRQWSDYVSLNDLYRLGAAGQIIELRQAENDPNGHWCCNPLKRPTS